MLNFMLRWYIVVYSVDFPWTTFYTILKFVFAMKPYFINYRKSTALIYASNLDTTNVTTFQDMFISACIKSRANCSPIGPVIEHCKSVIIFYLNDILELQRNIPRWTSFVDKKAISLSMDISLPNLTNIWQRKYTLPVSHRQAFSECGGQLD